MLSCGEDMVKGCLLHKGCRPWRGTAGCLSLADMQWYHGKEELEALLSVISASVALSKAGRHMYVLGRNEAVLLPFCLGVISKRPREVAATGDDALESRTCRDSRAVTTGVLQLITRWPARYHPINWYFRPREVSVPYTLFLIVPLNTNKHLVPII